MKRLLKHLYGEELEIRFGWIDKNTEGLCESDGRITINVNLWLADTYIHEMYHYINPEWSEKKVIKMTGKYLQRLTVKEICDLAERLKRLHKYGF